MNTENTKRYAWLEDIFSGTINYLIVAFNIELIKIMNYIRIMSRNM